MQNMLSSNEDLKLSFSHIGLRIQYLMIYDQVLTCSSDEDPKIDKFKWKLSATHISNIQQWQWHWIQKYARPERERKWKLLALVYIYSNSHWVYSDQNPTTRNGECFLPMFHHDSRQWLTCPLFSMAFNFILWNTILFPFCLVTSEESTYKHNFWVTF